MTTKLWDISPPVGPGSPLFPGDTAYSQQWTARIGRRTANPAEKVAGKEVMDLSPAVPNALWKLTLVYKELKSADKEKAAAQKLVSIYPDSRESFDATRLLAQIP